MSTSFDRQYFEDGIKTGRSLYENYRWLPELTIPMAHFLIDHLRLRPGDKVLDYGCAKGYTVKALRLLGIDAYGCDISPYAIENADPEIYSNCRLMENECIPPFCQRYDWIISKDVLEHLEAEALQEFLHESRGSASKGFHVIPLGNSESYNAPEYDADLTHKIAESAAWWIDTFESAGWKIESLTWSVRGIKENWTSRYPKGNGFFTLC
jgi:SAM-dependent methyltransferase